MSLDINELVRAVKQAAVEAVRAEAPVAVCYGAVTSASPLKIMVDQKKTLTGPQLILTNSARDFSVDLSAPPDQDRKTRRVHNALRVGEKVILLRCDGGQRYLVLDRWEAPT